MKRVLETAECEEVGNRFPLLLHLEAATLHPSLAACTGFPISHSCTGANEAGFRERYISRHPVVPA